MPVFQKFTELVKWLVNWATDTFPPMYQEVKNSVSQIASHASDAEASAAAAATSAGKAAESAQESAGHAQDAKLYRDETKEVATRQATPVRIGSVYTASAQDIADGAPEKMVDAAQLRSEFSRQVMPATTSVSGISRHATYNEIIAQTGKGVITADNVEAILRQAGGGGELDHSIVYGTTSDGLPYTLIEMAGDVRIVRIFGRLTATGAATMRINLPASAIAAAYKSVTGTVLEHAHTSFQVREDSASTSSLEYVDVGIWDGATFSWVAGSFYVQIEVQLGAGLLPARPAGVSVTSPSTGVMAISWQEA